MSLVKAVRASKLLNAPAVLKSLTTVKKYSPEILTTVGILGMVGTVVLASRATLKLEPVIDKIQDGRDIVREREEDEDYTTQDRTKDIAYVYIQGTLDIIKLYGPAITLGVSSAACIVGAHGIMKKRNVALVAALKTLETGFNEYRKRVIEEFGEEKDRDFRLGLRDEEVIDEKTGKKTTKKVQDPHGYSIYARLFDLNSRQWSKDAEMNLLTLRSTENHYNNKLQIQGHVFLNEIYDALDIPRSKAGAVVGWSLNGDGDKHISFGLYDEANQSTARLVNGYEPAVWLDFNVEGVILDYI